MPKISDYHYEIKINNSCAGVQANGTGQQTPEDEGTEQRRAARKRKPKVLYEVQIAGLLHRQPVEQSRNYILN